MVSRLIPVRLVCRADDDEPDYSQAELDRIQGEYPLPPFPLPPAGGGR